jgi:hypothetical protein
MAFTSLPGRPPREAFLAAESIPQITDDQFTREVRYWQRVRKVNGGMQAIVATSLLQEVMETVDMVRHMPLLENTAQARLSGTIEPLAKAALAGLGLAMFLRRSYPMLPELGEVADGARELNIDAKLRDGVAIAMVQAELEHIEEILPFDRDKKVSWYEDDLLIVSAATPALTTTPFDPGYQKLYGREFNHEAYVTLQPRLKASFVTPV